MFQDTKGLSDDEAGFGLRAFDLSVNSIKAECPWDDGVKCDVKSKNSFDSKYRRADGSCNNLGKVNYGRSTTPFQRIIEKPAYQKVNNTEFHPLFSTLLLFIFMSILGTDSSCAMFIFLSIQFV